MQSENSERHCSCILLRYWRGRYSVNWELWHWKDGNLMLRVRCSIKPTQCSSRRQRQNGLQDVCARWLTLQGYLAIDGRQSSYVQKCCNLNSALAIRSRLVELLEI